eukprot:CAMPEP_0203935858 /NCGR_PEP_ID=MMETSP0359-20131031/73533_1 /ASSEMBLY_ACC=CAM_ASM_000338 /TAXON_ID=268821 /ORGANISM="Scrippsiella Hangoei, Strain SHTV-5" /LENGTH=151 /DNA_ID=CAMNT_0050865753 /DNA_START=616 /DNA_END=1071 /DNA_ORIENTATION=-
MFAAVLFAELRPTFLKAALLLAVDVLQMPDARIHDGEPEAGRLRGLDSKLTLARPAPHGGPVDDDLVLSAPTCNWIRPSGPTAWVKRRQLNFPEHILAGRKLFDAQEEGGRLRAQLKLLQLLARRDNEVEAGAVVRPRRGLKRDDLREDAP